MTNIQSGIQSGAEHQIQNGASSGEGSTQTYRGVPIEELTADFRLACISRALDDREIALQKQSKVFFQISGAGHESLLLALARNLRPSYDWFFPYYRGLALMLGLGVTAKEVLLQAVGSAEDPSSAGRQMPAHWGFKDKNVVSQSSPTGSQCLPAVGCAEASRYIVRRPHLPGSTSAVSRLARASRPRPPHPTIAAARAHGPARGRAPATAPVRPVVLGRTRRPRPPRAAAAPP